MVEFSVYAGGLVCMSVCTDLSIEEATERLNREQPTGLDHGWHLSSDSKFAGGEPMPSPCNREPHSPRKHYLFNC